MTGSPPASRRPFLLAGAAGLLLIALTAVVLLRSGRPFPVDVAVHGWFAVHRTPALSSAERLLTATGTGVPAYALAAVAGAVAARARRRWWVGALAAVAALAVVQLIRLGLAAVVHRMRPPTADWATSASGWSFPSGHTTTSAAVAVLVVLAIRARAPSRAIGLGAATVACLWAVAVGLTRVALGVHWPSDVLGGWLLVAVITGCVAAAGRRHAGVGS
jgi:undecaprenyl-diphosphatase